MITKREWLISIVISLIVLECLGRFFRPESLSDFTTGSKENLKFEYDSELGWFPLPNLKYDASRFVEFQISNNSLGFRDKEWGKKSKSRLLFLGDSFIWGYEANEGERFTDLMANYLPSWEVLNAGIPGYGTDQEYILLRRIIKTVSPDVVFLLYCGINDWMENSGNFKYGLYKPYFILDGTEIVPKGIPVPYSISFSFRDFIFPFRYSYFARGLASIAINSLQFGKIKTSDLTLQLLLEIKKFTEEHNAKFILGYESISDEILAQIRKEKIEPINLYNTLRYPSLGNHWTPEGNRLAATTACKELSQRGIHCSTGG